MSEAIEGELKAAPTTDTTQAEHAARVADITGVGSIAVSIFFATEAIFDFTPELTRPVAAALAVIFALGGAAVLKSNGRR